MKRANVVNEEACQSLLLKMRGEGLVEVRYSQRAMAHRVIRGTSCQAICAPRTVADGRESRARIALGGTLFYENSDRSEYTGEVLPSAGDACQI
jgi:hypothetical protein